MVLGLRPDHLEQLVLGAGVWFICAQPVAMHSETISTVPPVIKSVRFMGP